AEPDASALEAAYRAAVAKAELDISLQPIVSVRLSAAAGFEVFGSLPVEGGQRIDLRRPAEPAPPAESAAFERILLHSGLQAGRMQLGAATVTLPLHIAISEALLSDGKEFSAVLDLLQFYPDLVRCFVLSIPGGLMSSAQHQQALGLLVAKG